MATMFAFVWKNDPSLLFHAGAEEARREACPRSSSRKGRRRVLGDARSPGSITRGGLGEGRRAERRYDRAPRAGSRGRNPAKVRGAPIARARPHHEEIRDPTWTLGEDLDNKGNPPLLSSTGRRLDGGTASRAVREDDRRRKCKRPRGLLEQGVSPAASSTRSLVKDGRGPQTTASRRRKSPRSLPSKRSLDRQCERQGHDPHMEATTMCHVRRRRAGDGSSSARTSGDRRFGFVWHDLPATETWRTPRIVAQAGRESLRAEGKPARSGSCTTRYSIIRRS